VIRSLLNSLLYFSSRRIIETPDQAGLDHRDLWLETDDRQASRRQDQGWHGCLDQLERVLAG
jgi:hypothetical protein